MTIYAKNPADVFDKAVADMLNAQEEGTLDFSGFYKTDVLDYARKYLEYNPANFIVEA